MACKLQRVRLTLEWSQMLNKECPKASFIPEIWQGHKNNGEGFWHALETLEQWF